MDNNVNYTLSLKDLLTGKLHEADHAAEKLETTLEGVEKVLGTLGVAFGVFEGLSWIKEGVEEAEKFHQAEAQLANTMQNMGNYSDEAYEKVVLGSEQMAEHLKFSNDEIVGLQSQLRLVGNIGEEEYERIAMASADMATKFGMSLDEAGNSLAKAINAPELMRRLAMTLKIDPATVEHIQDLAKSGHEAQARMELLAIAESKVGGAAQAAFDADPIAQFKKNMQEANESVGLLALDLLKDLSPALNDIGKAFRSGIEFLREHETEIKAVAFGVGIYAAATLLAEAPTLALTAAQWALNLAMSANPISLVVIALAAVGAAIYEAYQKVSWFHAGLWGLWSSVKTIGGMLKEFFEGLALSIHGALAFNPSEIKSGFSLMADAFKDGGSRIAKSFNEGYTNGLADFATKGEHKTAKPAIKGAKGEMGEAGKDLTPKATGTKAITINISINKMIETFKISTTNLQESASKVHEAVGNALTQAVNDPNIVGFI